MNVNKLGEELTSIIDDLEENHYLSDEECKVRMARIMEIAAVLDSVSPSLLDARIRKYL